MEYKIVVRDNKSNDENWVKRNKKKKEEKKRACSSGINGSFIFPLIETIMKRIFPIHSVFLSTLL